MVVIFVHIWAFGMQLLSQRLVWMRLDRQRLLHREDFEQVGQGAISRGSIASDVRVSLWYTAEWRNGRMPERKLRLLCACSTYR